MKAMKTKGLLAILLLISMQLFSQTQDNNVQVQVVDSWNKWGEGCIQLDVSTSLFSDPLNILASEAFLINNQYDLGVAVPLEYSWNIDQANDIYEMEFLFTNESIPYGYGTSENGGEGFTLDPYHATYTSGDAIIEYLHFGYIAQAFSDHIDLTLTVTNPASNTTSYNDVSSHTCSITRGCNNFSAEGDDVNGYTEAKDRLFLWNDEGKFNFEDNSNATVKTPSFLKKGKGTTNWGWWANSTTRYTEDLIAMVSKNGNYVIGWAFEDSNWASCNMKTAAGCFHLFPDFGMLAPGESKTVRGKYYILEGDEDDLYARYVEDFNGDLPPSTPLVSNGSPYCEGETVILTAEGEEGATYDWYSDAGLTTAIGTGATLTASYEGNYFVTQTVADKTSPAAVSTVAFNPIGVVIRQVGNELQTFSGCAGLTYTWSKDGSQISTGLENSIAVQGTGTYTVVVTKGILTASDDHIVTVASTDDALGKYINIYPNPNNGSFDISLPDGMDALVRVYDSIGNLIIQQTSTSIDISDRPSSIYTVEVTTSNSTITKRIVKQ